MKKWVSAFLAVLLAIGACAGALADSTVADTLGRVTMLVKEQLGLGDDFTDFNGEFYDYGERRLWNLNWHKGDSSLYVNCGEDGVIYEYSFDDYSEAYQYSTDYTPKFPAEGRDVCLPYAEAFLASVITGENVGWTGLDASGEEVNAYDTTGYSFSGNLTVNGYLTDIGVTVRVRLSDKAITYFYRSDTYSAYSGWNDPEALFDAAEARKLLESGYSMELRYVLDSNDSAKALLRYISVLNGAAYVDAETGEIVDVQGKYNELTANAAPSDMSMGGNGDYSDEGIDRATLTETELNGIERLRGSLDKEQLDKIARSYSEFGLGEGWALTRLSVEDYGDERLHASLTYMSEMSRDMLETRYNFDSSYLDSLAEEGKTFCVSKIVTLNAETGELESLYTYYPYSTGRYSYTGSEETGKAAAEEFLTKYYPEYFANSQLTWSLFNANDWYYSPDANFEYTRLVNGVLFDRNSLSVGVNVETGEIDSFGINWYPDGEIEFDSMEGIITPEQALSSYLMRYEVELGYVGVPSSYVEYNYSYNGQLCYSLVPDDTLRTAYIEGVDPHTGECVITDYGTINFRYDDIEGLGEQAAIEALAVRGVGFHGGSFEPAKDVTLRDLLVLLLQAGAYRDAADYADEDLVSIAYSLNILKNKNVDANETVTRARLARMLISMSGYGKAASLEGVFLCGFSDDAEISAEDYGYIAVAKGMGVATANAEGAFRPNAVATRAEAASMLYAFLTRSI